MSESLSRRDFLKLGGLALSTLVYNACVPRPIKESNGGDQSEIASKREINFFSPENDSVVKINFGEEKKINLNGLQWVPDTKTSYIKNPDGSITYFVAAGTEGYRLDGESIYKLGEPKKIIGPDYKWGEYGINNYRAPGTVLKDNNGRFWSFDHIEEWQSKDNYRNFTGRIGLSVSSDGVAFSDCGIIIDGSFTRGAGETVTGAGQPCAIILNENGTEVVHLYYTEWSNNGHFIACARAPLSQIDNPDAWSKYLQEDFSSSAKKGEADPVIKPPEGEIYAALVSVSRNNYLGKYLSIFETSTGFWIATSEDSVRWDNYQKIADFPKPHDKRVKGEYWYSYPTLLSESTGDSAITSNEGVIVYSKGKYFEGSHNMVVRKFNIS